MDELIAIAKRLDDAFIRFASETEKQATSRRNQAVKDAATALRASQAEIARLREALSGIIDDIEQRAAAYRSHPSAEVRSHYKTIPLSDGRLFAARAALKGEPQK